MSKETNIVKGLKLEMRQVKDTLRIIIHSILFQRELGVIVPRTVESEFGIQYLTLNDAATDRTLEESIAAFENKIVDQNSATVVLSFYQCFKKKSFLVFQENAKHVWEEWKIPIRIQHCMGEDSKKSDASLGKKIRKRLLAIIERICERKDHLPPMGEPDDPNVIRYPFDITTLPDMSDNYYAKSIGLLSFG